MKCVRRISDKLVYYEFVELIVQEELRFKELSDKVWVEFPAKEKQS